MILRATGVHTIQPNLDIDVDVDSVDFDWNSEVDIYDLAVFAEQWLLTGS